jgi:N-acetylglucosaminyldiphosphoundecaprenol N-acetyl-beta-D-mannosaminyltransferase
MLASMNNRSSSESQPRRAVLDLGGSFGELDIRRRRLGHYCSMVRWKVTTGAKSKIRRLADVAVAALLLSVLSPLLLVLWVAGGVQKELCLGRWAKPFWRYQFSSRAPVPFRALPMLFNVLRGDMSFVGPRSLLRQELPASDPAAWKRYDLRPGLLSLSWLRKQANIAYTGEVGIDVEYIETTSLRGDLGIVLRSIPAMFFRGSGAEAKEELKLLGVRLDNPTMHEASQRIVNLAEAGKPGQVCFVNADCFNIAASDTLYRRTLAAADMVLADGIGVRLAASAFGQKIRENINGTDMLPYLCETLQRSGKSIYLLGGKQGVAEDVVAWMRDRYPALRVAGLQHGYFSSSEEPGVLEAVRRARPAVLLVAFGAPKQEKWIAAHKRELGPAVAIGVGGLLDFYSGRVARAPVWMRELGLEWMFRFLQEPGRMWRRYFVGNAMFLLRVARERMFGTALALDGRTGSIS